ncbi:MAG: pyridoxal phosphate-dependent aminotransferase [Actinobacteria bacterium]|nr:pyridoxal phosphate-dependent aminotransferase [Cyanobacteriota bacterium]MCL6088252.1 pyridoxal phosphate-dependent aminotransferase [Actinomycetota bacterium]
MQTAKRIENLGTENAFKVLAEVNKLKNQGKDIISFAIGEPDFNTPENIKDAGIKAIKENYTHYNPSAGIPELREEIAKHISKTRKIKVDPEEVVVTPGGKPIIFFSIFALINPGDEVIYPNPGFPIYESLINFIDGVAVPIPIIEEKNFSIDVNYLEKIITPKTKMIILNSPHNPTGGMIEKEDLQSIAELAIKHDIIIFSDEIYSGIVFDGEFNSIASFKDMKERTIILDGFSKTYSMTGWRIGYGIFNKDIAAVIANLGTNSVSCTATFTQMAAVEALRGTQDDSIKMAEIFKQRSKLIVDGLNDIKGIKCLYPKGAFYVFPNVTEACRNLGFESSIELQQYLLHEGGVAVLPRTSFGVKNKGEKEEYIRLSFATSNEAILNGLARIKKAIEKR